MRICDSLGGASDRDQWSRSAVDDVTIIDRFAVIEASPTCLS